MSFPSQLFFLPGASGNIDFWQPVASQLNHTAKPIFFGWPGFGETPADSSITSLADLTTLLLAQIDKPTALIAQSMGGIVAVQAALQRPDLITHLVLTVTSGGVDMTQFEAQDWRPEFRVQNPNVPEWFLKDQSNHSDQLTEIKQPVLLLWGDADPISPVAVGQYLAEVFPDADLHVFEGGGHDLGFTHATHIAPLIDQHLEK
ncbi:alpha/beta fold hydrolase [Paenalcaligenes faecalis]|uniref:alpha/beta fold hydrolase n=1 Tax=Paenalcaligenes faecalis TaxID=2980099 RepID=UPI0022B95E6E|nr:alpha/beta hydrolase [Paenalcaligenes faecalis]